jgi:hypothetical protein
MPPRFEALRDCAAPVGYVEVPDPREAGEEFSGFGAAGEPDFRFGEAFVGGIDEDAGDGNIRAQGDAGKDGNAPGLELAGESARVGWSSCELQDEGEDGPVILAKPRFKTVGEALDEDAEEGVGALRLGERPG